MHASLAVIVLLVAAAAALAPVYRAEKPFPGQYIVVFHSNTSVAETASTVEAFSLLGVTMKNTYKSVIKGFAAKLTQDQLMKVRSHPNVNYVDQDGEARIAQGGQCQVQQNAPSWGLGRITEVDPSGNDDFRHLNYGTGTNIYIIDTGIYIAHSDFGGRARWGYTASDIAPGEYDGNGHGTHCASTAAGATYGISKRANLIAVKCLSDSGGGSWSGIIESIEWVAEEHRKTPNIPSIGSMSLGGGRQQSVNDATVGATLIGIVMVAAAGNSNTDTCSFSPASASYHDGTQSAVIAVGATEQGPVRDRRASYSNYGGQCTTLMAPGTSITGAWIGNPNAERTISGTSMACPHVAGVAAAILGDTRYRSFTPRQVRDKLFNDCNIDKIDMNCPGSGVCSTTPNSMLYTSTLCS